MMDEDAFNVPKNVGCQNLIVMDGTYSASNSASVCESNLLGLNNQDQIMPGYPLHSMLQGDTMNDFHACILSTDHAGFSDSDIQVLGNAQLGRNTIRDTSISSPSPVSGTEVQSQIMVGTPMSAASLAMLWAANCEARENYDNIAALASTQCPVEALKASASNEYLGTLNCAVGISIDCKYGGVPGDLSRKWDFNKSLATFSVAGTGFERIRFQPSQFTGNMNSSDWISAECTTMSSSCHSGTSAFGNELSLSLATCQPSIICEPTITDQCSDISYSGVTSHSFYKKRLGPAHTSSNKDTSSGFFSYKPVQLPQLLSGSEFLHVIQEILTEIGSYSLGTLDQMSYPASSTAAGPNISSSHAAKRGYSAMQSDDLPDEDESFELQMDPPLQAAGVEVNKKHLLALLQVVDDQYNQCLDEIHTVVSAFHAVTELDPHIHASFALQTLSFLHKNLRERISNYILAIGAQLRQGVAREKERSLETSFLHQQWDLQQRRRKEHQLSRPQRGLPERHPKDAEKHLLAVKSGLLRSQVSNWFINARVRLWKPMIGEMYAEMNRRKNCLKHQRANMDCRNHISIDNQRYKLS